jgi:shikimate dehydrogenase
LVQHIPDRTFTDLMSIHSIESFLKSEAEQGPFGVIMGYPVAQSLSPEMHNYAAQYHGLDFTYHRLEVHPDELQRIREVIHHPNFVGANVTVPHKIDVANILDDLSDEAAIIGAVNTIVKEGNRRIGYNTDARGFFRPLEPHKERLSGRNAMIFGTGGATRAIVYALNQIGMEKIWLVARQPQTIHVADFFASKNIRTVSYKRWTTEADQVELIINATPLGMIPDVDQSPIEEYEKDALIGKIVYDIVYKPIDTKLLQYSKQVMAETIDGVGMLVNQGAEAFRLWTGLEFPVDQIDARVRRILNGSL